MKKLQFDTTTQRFRQREIVGILSRFLEGSREIKFKIGEKSEASFEQYSNLLAAIERSLPQEKTTFINTGNVFVPSQRTLATTLIGFSAALGTELAICAATSTPPGTYTLVSAGVGALVNFGSDQLCKKLFDHPSEFTVKTYRYGGSLWLKITRAPLKQERRFAFRDAVVKAWD